MKSVSEISSLDYQVKNGEMKCNANEVRYLLYIIEQMNDIICGQFYGDLTEEEQEKHKLNLEYLEYFQNKYLYLPALREKEKGWFDMMQTAQMKSKNLENSKELEKANEAINFCKSEYGKIRKERKQIASELDAIKAEKYSGVFF